MNLLRKMCLMFVLVGILSACGAKKEAVVVLFPFSDQYKAFSESALIGVEMAAGDEVDIIKVDGGCDEVKANEALLETSKSVKIKGVIALCDNSVKGIYNWTKKKRIPVVVIADDGVYKDDHVWQIAPGRRLLLIELAKKLYNEGNRSIAILGEITGNGNTGQNGNTNFLANSFIISGGKVALMGEFPSASTGEAVVNQLVKVKDEADIVIPLIYSPKLMIDFLKAFDANGLVADMDVYGYDNFLYLLPTLQVHVLNLENMGLTMLDYERDIDEDFNEEYKELHKMNAPEYVAQAYDALKLIDKCGGEGHKAFKKCVNGNVWESVSGDLNFDTEQMRMGTIYSRDIK